MNVFFYLPPIYHVISVAYQYHFIYYNLWRTLPVHNIATASSKVGCNRLRGNSVTRNPVVQPIRPYYFTRQGVYCANLALQESVFYRYITCITCSSPTLQLPFVTPADFDRGGGNGSDVRPRTLSLSLFRSPVWWKNVIVPTDADGFPRVRSLARHSHAAGENGCLAHLPEVNDFFLFTKGSDVTGKGMNKINHTSDAWTHIKRKSFRAETE